MNNDTLIEKYFSKQLSKVELLEFEQLYAADADFKEEVDFIKNLKSVTKSEDEAQFKKQLKSYETEFLNKKEVYSSKWFKSSMAVAAILLIAFSFTFFLNQEVNTNQLFTSYFEPSKNVSAPIVRSESDDQLINKAFIAYGETNYEKAIPLFENAFDLTKNSELLFYKANAFLALNKTEEAIKTFKEHLAYTDILTKRTHWYLALAYIKTNQLEEAKQQLNLLINSDETFKKSDATSLLKKLE